MNSLLNKILLFLLFIAPIYVFSQSSSISAMISNNVTSFPVTGYPQLFYSQFHPGIDVAKSWKINKSTKHQLWIDANVGVFYHRFVQTALKVYPSIDYKFLACERFRINIGLGLGYLHSFDGYEVFKLKEGSGYETEKVWIGRPQFLGTLNWGCDFKLKKDADNSPLLVFQLRTNVQGPFVNNYVPILPVNSVLLGLTLPLKNK